MFKQYFDMFQTKLKSAFINLYNTIEFVLKINKLLEFFITK